MASSSFRGSGDLDNTAAIESSFQRLLGAIENERDQIRATWEEIEQESDITTAELGRLKQETEDWVRNEKGKIDKEWNRLDSLTERMRQFFPNPDTIQVLHINCSGKAFTVPRSTLCLVEESKLSMMFSEPVINQIPRDQEGRLYLDINPALFSIIVEYLQNRRLRADAPVPVIPVVHRQSMEELAEALNLTPFMFENRIATVHNTSLYVYPIPNMPSTYMIQAMHPGWQVISAENPLSMARSSYFEVKILANPNPSGGLAIGICGHIPSGDEVHSIHLSYSVLYNSHNGLVGDCFDDDSVQKGVEMKKEDVFGVRYEPTQNGLIWFYNRKVIGASILKQDYIEKMTTLYPVFALYDPETRIQVDFKALMPSLAA